MIKFFDANWRSNEMSPKPWMMSQDQRTFKFYQHFHGIHNQNGNLKCKPSIFSSITFIQVWMIFFIHNCILGSTIEKICKLWTLKWEAKKVYMVWRRHFTCSFKTCNFASIYKDLQWFCFNALNSIHLRFWRQEFPINPSI